MSLKWSLQYNRNCLKKRGTFRPVHYGPPVSQRLEQKLIHEREEKELRFILIGKAGNGKSSFGNSLCDAKVFPTSSSSSSCTKECRVRYRDFEGTNLIICDTPGLFDTNVNLKDTEKEICRSLERMVSPGPHAFLIVLSAAHRFTEEEQKVIEYINEMFGSDAGKYCILIITREEDILNDEKTVEQYFQEADEPLKRLLAQCQNRYLAINNRSGKTERDEKIRQLLNIVRKMLKENKTPYYTNEMFKQAEKEFQEKEVETLNKIKVEIEAQTQNLREEIQREIQENLSKAAYEFRNMHRDEVNNSQPTALKTCLDFASVVTKYAAEILNTTIMSRQAIAAIEAQTAHNEHFDMLPYSSRQLLPRSIQFFDDDHGYRVEGSGETDSDSD